MYKTIKDKHICTKEDIKWDNEPTGFESDLIEWYGKCEFCGRKVYEEYNQQPELYDAETSDLI